MSVKTPSQPVILVDGSSYLFRAFHALPPLTTSDGHPTGAVRGVISMIRKLTVDYPDGQVIVVFDAKGKTFRHDMYSEYKANRPPMPDDLRVQIDPVHTIIQAMGLPLLAIPGVEADDVIGTLAKQAHEQNRSVIISTGDKDMAQLVNNNVYLLNTMSKDNKLTDTEAVIEKFGVKPDQIIDYLALMGDSVDNIPGVPKCGPKTAVKWLSLYGSLSELMANATEIKGKIGENLRASLEFLPLSYELATIKTDVTLESDIESLQTRPADTAQLLEHFKRYEFKSWVKELDNRDSGNEEQEQSKNIDSLIDRSAYETIFDQQHFERWITQLDIADEFAFDTETTSLDYMKAEIVGLSFALTNGQAAYIPLAHDYEGAPSQLERERVLNALKPILESSIPKIIGQNLKYDRNVLIKYGIELSAIKCDTMLESYVLNSTASRHDMDSLSEKYLNHETIHFEDIAGKGAKQITFNQVEVETASQYAAEDADITLRLHQAIWPQLSPSPELKYVFEEIENPLIPVLSRMEMHGALIHSESLQQFSQELAGRLDTLEEQAHNLAGEAFNLGSPKQLGAILYEKLKLPVLKKTPKGAPSTAEPVLQELAQDYELPSIVLEHRSLAKLKSTYTDKLPEMVNSDTGRVHTSYHQAVTATGRLSSSDPNLQNIPVRRDEGKRIRQAFIASEGYKLVAADYSQIELRIMAHLSQDEGLLDAFSTGKDVHQATAAEIFGLSIEDVDSDQRRAAKAINFGLIYGMSAFGLANQLNVSRKSAQEYMDVYFERYPGILAYMERTRHEAAENGFVETIFGRRLYLPEINTRNAMRRKAAERTAINAPMQGTAADLIKLAMINVDRWLSKNAIDAKMIMQVHDELVFEVHASAVDELTTALRPLMCDVANLKVPLVVDIGTGDNWDEAH